MNLRLVNDNHLNGEFLNVFDSKIECIEVQCPSFTDRNLKNTKPKYMYA